VAALPAKSKELLLGALLCAIGIVVWVNLGSMQQSERAAGRRGGPAGRIDPASIKVYPVDWAALTATRPSYDPNGRNIFQFGALPRPTPVPLTPAEQEAIRKAQQAAQEAAAQQAAQQQVAQQAAQAAAQRAAEEQAKLPPPPPPRPVPPSFNYKFIGYIGPPEHKIAVLHDGTDLVFVKKGEVITGSFRILDIGYESIKIGYTDPQFRGESQTLPMSSSY
jgi:hypothetical protein